MTNNNSDLVRAFLAKGGTITKAPEGVAYGVSKEADKEKRLANRIQRAATENELIGQRHTVVDRMGRARVRNGLGEWVG